MSQSYNLAFSTRRSSPRTWRRNQNTVKFRTSISLGPISHTVLIAVMLAVLGLIYLTQITKTSTYGYELSELNTRQEQLASENRDLEVEAAKLQALEKVQQSNVAQTLSTPESTDYARTN
jgi:hypothetical protein